MPIEAKNEDADGRLRDNLAGLDWLCFKISGQSAGGRPIQQTWQAPTTKL